MIRILILCLALLSLVCISLCGHNGDYGGDNNKWDNSASQRGQRPSFGGGSNGNKGLGQNSWNKGNFADKSPNSFNNPEGYGYDYNIPGADVHFAARREAANGNLRRSGDLGSNKFHNGNGNGFGGHGGWFGGHGGGGGFGGHGNGFGGHGGGFGGHGGGFGGHGHGGGFGGHGHGNQWHQGGSNNGNQWQQGSSGGSNQWRQKNSGGSW